MFSKTTISLSKRIQATMSKTKMSKTLACAMSLPSIIGTQFTEFDHQKIEIVNWPQEETHILQFATVLSRAKRVAVYVDYVLPNQKQFSGENPDIEVIVSFFGKGREPGFAKLSFMVNFRDNNLYVTYTGAASKQKNNKSA